jgi:hypothetical protein
VVSHALNAGGKRFAIGHIGDKGQRGRPAMPDEGSTTELKPPQAFVCRDHLRFVVLVCPLSGLMLALVILNIVVWVNVT